ncbi:hypothetical protein D6D01_09438 [Aureobasidium pullulans]|uniref:N-acetyltransferase domain-containing protein n=1 Tax=Aureobasidium pullulans TaxID=5580 RepID=A0A4S9K5Z3_AURPU|nr:hypothetical protein D6D01_09438 [Aureobasidium pullulans]
MRQQMTMSTTINVRVATTLDAETIAYIHVTAWQAAYVNIVPQAYLDALTVNDKITMWKRILSDPVKASNILVAEHNDPKGTAKDTHLLGFASFGDADEFASNEDLRYDGAKSGELRAIYVDPRAWSKGAGQCLWRATQQRFTEAKVTIVVVSTFAKNERAIRFYQAAGFAKSDAGNTEIGGSTVKTVRLTKTLVLGV